MPKYGYVVVEGPHDVAFVGRLLKPFGFHRVKMLADVEPFWHRLIPNRFPYQGDLLKRVPVPLFMQNATHSVAIQSAAGDANLVKKITDPFEPKFMLLDKNDLTGIGLLLDSDSAPDISAAKRYADISVALDEEGFTLPKQPGKISFGSPRLGAFVLPDNQNPGTLEDLLIECAEIAYPDLLGSARTHVRNALADASLEGNDRKELDKPAGRNKATVGSIASILRPGKTIAVSLQDNRWLSGETLAIVSVRAVQRFLEELFDLS